jgi:hypothetical protein
MRFVKLRKMKVDSFLDLKDHKRLPVSSDLYLFILGFIVAFSLNLVLGFGRDTFPDGIIYLEQSELIKSWMLGSPMPTQGITLPIGLSVMILILSPLPWDPVIVFKFVACIVYGLCTLLSWKILISLGISRRIRKIAILAITIDPLKLSFVTGVQSEVLAACMILFWTHFSISVKKGHGELLPWTLLNLLSVCAVFIRPNLLLLYLGFLLFHLFLEKKRQRKRILSLFILTFIFPISIAHVITSKMYAGFIFLSTNGPTNLLLSCKEYLAPQILGFMSESENRQLNSKYFDEVNSLEFHAQQLKSPYDRYEYLRSVAVDECSEQWNEVAGMYLLKSLFVWRPYLNFGSQSEFVFLVSLLIQIPLLISLVAIYFIKSDESTILRFRAIVLVISISLSLSLLPSAFQLRHRIAAMESIQWVCLALLMDKSGGSKINSLRFFRKRGDEMGSVVKKRRKRMAKKKHKKLLKKTRIQRRNKK